MGYVASIPSADTVAEPVTPELKLPSFDEAMAKKLMEVSALERAVNNLPNLQAAMKPLQMPPAPVHQESLLQTQSQTAIPLPANDPCIPLCDFEGGWKTLPCQECILRGLLNGWLRRSKRLKGYNYSQWSRDYCLNYQAFQQSRFTTSSSVSFAKCFFDQMHVACNL
jgi:hypothetical protein